MQDKDKSRSKDTIRNVSVERVSVTGYWLLVASS